MSQRQVHIVSFDVPFAPNYGGILDVYLRARALKQAGFHVTIHAFEYGRGRMKLDPTICDEVFYYERGGKLSSLSSKPYIVNSRKNKLLLIRLLEANGLIILEGEHCTSFVHQLERAKKKFVIRAHNIEWQYYRELANSADTIYKKTYYRTESRRLKHHEHHLYKSHLLCISKEDQNYFEAKGARTSLVYPPLFFDLHAKVEPVNEYALFQGNLSVSENLEAVRMIIAQLKNTEYSDRIVIAGKNPPDELVREIQAAGMKCFANPNEDGMLALVEGAEVHLSIGFQRSGLKLKLLKALETGKVCIATQAMLHGTELHDFCLIWNEQTPLKELLDVAFSHKVKDEERIAQLKKLFDPKIYSDFIESLF